MPLAKGVVRDGTLVCAFHHACFDARTGRQTQPPGHGDLRRYDVTVEGERVRVEVTDADPHPMPAHVRQGADPRRVVLAGAGAAADECVLALREEGFEGSIEMISPGAVLPYDRTMLSKAVLAGQKPIEDLTLTARDAFMARDVAMIDGTVARVEEGRVVLEGGGIHAFDMLLLAPGGEPRRLDVPGAGLDGIFTLRSGAQAAILADAAGEAARAVVIGGGFIGMEGALSLAKRGVEVTVVLPQDVPLAGILGEVVAKAIQAEHLEAGIRFETGAEVTGFDGEGHVTAVRTADGRVLEADLVLLAVGVVPATKGIEGLSAEEDGGVAVGPDLAVPGLAGVLCRGRRGPRADPLRPGPDRALARRPPTRPPRRARHARQAGGSRHPVLLDGARAPVPLSRTCGGVGRHPARRRPCRPVPRPLRQGRPRHGRGDGGTGRGARAVASRHDARRRARPRLRLPVDHTGGRR